MTGRCIANPTTGTDEAVSSSKTPVDDRMRGRSACAVREYTARMLRRVQLLVVLLVVLPTPAFAWGSAAHRYIMSRAIDLLPAEIKPFFNHYRDEIVSRSIDPDLWRRIGWEDDPNHFVNFGVEEYGPYPFRDLPREYGAAIEKFGCGRKGP
jgi:hypothetical protein